MSWTVSVTEDVNTYTPLELSVSLAPADVPQIRMVVLSDAAGLAQDSKLKVAVTDNYDNEGIGTTWIGYVQERKTQNQVLEVMALGSEFWLGRRLITFEKGPDDVGVVVKAYIDNNGAPVTSGGIDQTTGTNYKQDDNYTTILQLLEELRQLGYRCHVKYVSALNEEELQLFKERLDWRAATREIRYGDA